MTIQAIETRYAGHRFRSRLEARWAVAFDAIGIRWEYEAQGVVVEDRLTTWGDASASRPYLPDFWLPDHDVYCEVKGALTDEEARPVLEAAAYLSSAGGAGCGYENGGHDLVVLGPIPRTLNAPARLHMHKGTLSATPWLFEARRTGHDGRVGGDEPVLASDSGEFAAGAGRLTEGLSTYMWLDLDLGLILNRAYSAARSARFEHGQSGAA